MNILLLFPRSTFLSAPMVWPPLGLWYLAAQLESQGHTTDFWDMSSPNGRAFPDDGDYDQLWISAKTVQTHEINWIAEQTKDWSRTRTVLGGAAPWVSPGKYVGKFDLVVCGEGDHPETVRMVVNTGNKGVYFANLSDNLDWVLPPVRRWSLDYSSYMTDQEGNGYRMTSMFTARGCPMSCSFCESGRMGVIWGNKTRYEPIDVVEQQIIEILDLGFTGIAYYDDVFILNRRRTQQILQLHKDYGRIPWRCFLRSDILIKHGGRDYLQEMKDAGLIEVFVGVESASDVIKGNIHKGTTIQQDTQVLEWCKQLGITCKMSFIFGLPGETMETMVMTRDWIFKHRPHIAQVDRLIPFPGTPLTDHPDEYDLTYEVIPDEEWFFRGKYDEESKSFVSTSHLTREEIDKFWHETEKMIKDEGLSTYVH